MYGLQSSEERHSIVGGELGRGDVNVGKNWIQGFDFPSLKHTILKGYTTRNKSPTHIATIAHTSLTLSNPLWGQNKLKTRF
jgi:hypothetical protein